MTFICFIELKREREKKNTNTNKQNNIKQNTHNRLCNLLRIQLQKIMFRITAPVNIIDTDDKIT